MPEPTLTELREKAERLLRWVSGEPVDRAEMEASAGEIAADYLRLTDPDPLTAEHCRAAGMDGSLSGSCFISVHGVIADCSKGEPFGMDVPFATAGQLELALALAGEAK